jgi:hypothetical protein
MKLAQKISIDTVNLVDDLIALSFDPFAQNLADKSVSLRDTDDFHTIIDFCSREEIREARQELVSAVKLQDWSQGLRLALKILSSLGG